jgi:SsrA-binding protein
MAPKKESPEKVVCRNKRARHDYDIEETFEAGLVLVGTEVKSLRAGAADIKDAYATYREGELFLVSAHIGAYEKAARFTRYEPRRERKLLLHKRVIEKLGQRIKERGYTLVPLEIYFKKGYAKVLLGLAKGRKQYDHRQEILAESERREMREVQRKGRGE